MRLEYRYEEGFRILKELSGPGLSVADIERINEIHKRTDRIWKRYVTMVQRRSSAKYLLLAEAPPWSSSGHPQYILDTESKPRILLNAICRAFFGDLVYKSVGVARTLEMLAELGFIVIDTLPFAVSYQKRRTRLAYRRLVAESCRTYLQDKISQCDLIWHNQVRIAFAFKINGLTVIESLNGQIRLGTLLKSITEGMIAVNSAGYTDGQRLREIYEL